MDFDVNMLCMFFCGFSAGIVFVILYGFVQETKQGLRAEEEYVKVNQKIKSSVTYIQGISIYTNVLKKNMQSLKTRLGSILLKIKIKKFKTQN